MKITMNCELTSEELEDITNFVKAQDTTDRECYHGYKRALIVLNNLEMICEFEKIGNDDSRHIAFIKIKKGVK